jgi:hypothetical protein
MLPRKPLKDYTNEELHNILEDNENIDSTELTYICSEVLRRWMSVEIIGKNETYLT